MFFAFLRPLLAFHHPRRQSFLSDEFHIYVSVILEISSSKRRAKSSKSSKLPPPDPVLPPPPDPPPGRFPPTNVVGGSGNERSEMNEDIINDKIEILLEYLE
ncbi:hypothetical protein GCK72_018377 [Caenorhabditis remanei]|uniref:Uncharacterized protein n=1 Tax=Caenorhabditis remanei TaxID=31234 RepID=A0A6A5GAX1_CAERE|nr:hypothetical protein GCK72_018377 [Caenorhabditis remanei]KAF1751823.1 hypothetical protein GCK72_018377 [Caenorhabditis remanei]